MDKDKKGQDIQKTEILSITGIIIAAFFVGGLKIQLPGLYFDAAYPDYLAAVGAFPQVDNFTQITKHVGLPLLGNFYHGTMTAAVQYLVLKCVGHASLLTLRLTNLSYIAIIASIVYLMGRRICKNNWIPFLCTLLCVTAPNVLAISRTQYFVMLPGVIFFMISVYCLWIGTERENEGKQKFLFLSGLFQGIAFYGYFSYLFLAPVSLLFILLDKRKESTRGIAVFLYLWGILCGSFCYFAGFWDSAVTNMFGDTVIARALLGIGIVILSVIMAVPVFTILCSRFNKFGKTVFKIYLPFGIFMCIMALVVVALAAGAFPEKLQKVTGLFSMIGSRREGSVLLIFWDLTYQLMSNIRAQQIIFEGTIEGSNVINIILFVLLTVATAVVLVIDRIRGVIRHAEITKYVVRAYCYLIGFYICSLPMISGMQVQHLVVVYFGIFIIIMFDLNYLLAHLPFSLRVLTVAVIIGMGLGGNAQNDVLFIDRLEKTEGRGKYSAALNEFAAEAYADEYKEEKIYVFPESGFTANFIYLTSNSCKVIRDSDIMISDIQSRIEAGYTIVIAAFDESMIDELQNNLEYGRKEIKQWYSKEERLIFTSVSLECDK